MGQFLDYLASVFNPNQQVQDQKGNNPNRANNHVTFSENSFTQAFTGRAESERASKLALVTQSNKQTILTYQAIGAMAFLAHLYLVTVPKFQLDSFDFSQTESWQHVTLTLVPFVVYLASIGAMSEVNKPLSEGAKLTPKNSELDLNNNEFIHSLKVIIILMALCQVSSIFSDNLLWSSVMIVPIWCYQLTSKVAHSEYKRFAPSPKKQWVKLNMSRSPKPDTPRKQAKDVSAKQEIASQVKATPRTRTRRAVKNIITGVSDKYHAFEQNVAHQLSQKIFTPLSPKLKMIE